MQYSDSNDIIDRMKETLYKTKRLKKSSISRVYYRNQNKKVQEVC